MTAAPERSALRSGVVPVLLTPFLPNGEINFVALRREIDFLLAMPVAGLGVGFGSEVTRLSFEERLQIVNVISEMTDDTTHLVASIVAGSTKAGESMARALGEAGATVLMAPPPAGVGSLLALRDQIVSYFSALSSASGTQIMVQDAPAMTGVEMPVAIFQALLAVPSVTSFKVEVAAPAPKIGALRLALGEDVALFGGQAGLDFYHELQRGVNGTLPGAATPEVFIKALSHYEVGDHSASSRLLSRHLGIQLLAQRDFDTFLYVQKLLLVRRGIFDSAALREPCAALDPELAREVLELADILLSLDGLPKTMLFDEEAVVAESEVQS